MTLLETFKNAGLRSVHLLKEARPAPGYPAHLPARRCYIFGCWRRYTLPSTVPLRRTSVEAVSETIGFVTCAECRESTVVSVNNT